MNSVNTFAVGKRESMLSLIVQSTKASSSEYEKKETNITQKAASGVSNNAHSDRKPSARFTVAFSALTPGENRDIRTWDKRLSREEVFSRYYSPEPWEIREMKTAVEFLELQNPDILEIVVDFLGDQLGREATQTKMATTSLFFPGYREPKSVLLKRGPILFDGEQEMELMLLTHGFVISQVGFDTLLSSLVRSHLDPKENYAQNNALTDWDEKLGRICIGATEKKLAGAYLLSDIEHIEVINICPSKSTQVLFKSQWVDLMFAIFVTDGEDPLIIVCSKPEQRSAWVDAFQTCYVKSMKMKANSGSESAKNICHVVGWQHQKIRSSVFSLVVANDVAELRKQVANPLPGIGIDDQDKYHGYTALHYAVVLGHLKSAELLLQYGAEVNLNDNNGKTPLDHAALSVDQNMSRLLERFGAKKSSSEILFKEAIEEQEQLKKVQPKSCSNELNAMAKGATGVMSDAMSALRERGENIDRLDDKTSQLLDGVKTYADNARGLKNKMKAKNKKFSFFGL